MLVSPISPQFQTLIATVRGAQAKNDSCQPDYLAHAPSPTANSVSVFALLSLNLDRLAKSHL